MKDSNGLLKVLDKLEGVKKAGKGYKALCPAHTDSDPSLSINQSGNGRVLLYCFAGCAITDILKALGLKKNDLINTNYISPISKEIVKTYDYKDENGNLLFQVCRTKPKGFFQRRPDGNGWKNRLANIKPILYRLQEVYIAKIEGNKIFVVEGEKDADRLAALGLTATCNPGGAGKWRDYYSDNLKDANVIILPDNDKAGIDHAKVVANSLQGKAASVKLINLPDLPEKGDISNWLDNGGTVQTLQRIVEEVPEYGVEPWGIPAPLDEHVPPPFPVCIFPEWLAEYVKQLSRSTQTPPDLAAMLIIAVLSTSLAKKFTVNIRPGWIEPVNLYTIVVLPPGERKSAVFAEVTEPIEEYERKENERLKPKIEESKTEYKILEDRLKTAQSKAAKDNDTIQEAKELARDLSNYYLTAPLRLIADDISPEKTANLLSEQGGRLSILSAEGGIFDILAGRYSQNNSCNFEVFLKGHSGDNLRVDRVGRPPEFVEKPALTVGLTVQPEILEGLFEKPGFRGRGLLARFLYSLPPSMVGMRDTNPTTLSEDVKQEYKNGILRLLQLKAEIDDNNKLCPHVLDLLPEASKISNEFAAWLEPQLAPFEELNFIADWAAKLHGTVIRIAGLLHIAKYKYLSSPKNSIEAETMFNAITIGEYLIEHAKAAFNEMGGNELLSKAKYVLRWIEKQERKDFSKRDAFNGGRCKFKKVEEIEPALQLLIDYGYIREKNIQQKTRPGRKPSPIFEVNTYTQNTQNTRNKQ